jgi:hypothetical protein
MAKQIYEPFQKEVSTISDAYFQMFPNEKERLSQLQLLEESPDKTIDDIEPPSLTSEQIHKGIAIAEKNAIFTSIIGEFRQTG